MTGRPPIMLPSEDGSLRPFQPRSQSRWPSAAPPSRERLCYAAVHVVADPSADTTPVGPAALDWDSTLAYRRHIWGLGLGVAEAMDTAQRGMGLDWRTAQELIRRVGVDARTAHGRLVCGAQTDHLTPGAARSLQDVVAAYEHQCEVVEAAGGQIVLMASRELCRLAQSSDDYLSVYGTLLRQLREPVIIHWLGEVFDPMLRGYWGSDDLDQAVDNFCSLLEDHAENVEGVKISLLDPARELAVRQRLPQGMRLFTGDDFDYVSMIAGDGRRHSDALLGALDMIAPAAAAALGALDQGDDAGFRGMLEPTLPLSRHVFSAPTQYYKVGVVFLAYLNGHQSHFRMVGGVEGSRSVLYLAKTFRLADAADLLVDVDLAVDRMQRVLAVAGVVQ